jgi:ferritin
MKPQSLSKWANTRLSQRLKDEYTAHRLYRYVGNCLRNEGMNIAAEYFFKEADDELEHAKKLEKYATDWNSELEFLPLESPQETNGLVDIIDKYYTLEHNLLKSYSKDMAEAMEEGEIPLFVFLQEFVTIQTKALAEVSDILNQLELFDKSDKNWIFQFEKKIFG